MIDQLWNFVAHQMATNQFFSGAALTAMLMSVAYQLKAVPLQVWGRIHRYIVFRAFIEEEDPLCSNIDIFIHQKYPGRLKNVEIKTNEKDINMSHDNDYIYIWYKRRRILISKRREKLENANSTSSRYARSYNISGIWAKRAILTLLTDVMKFAEEYKEAEQAKRKKIDTFVLDYSDWSRLRNPGTIKTFDSIFLHDKQLLIDDLEKFRRNEETYKKLQIPFRRGYLFYGEPGNGKSTLAAAIADYMKYNIFLLDVSTINSGNQFTRAFKNIPDNSVVVLEDIDTMFKNRKTSKQDETDGKVSLTTLLNALSGVSQKQNIITVITTNHINDLDDALTREGRCDFKMEVKNPTKEIVEEYLTTVFEEEIELKRYTSRSFVKVQESTIRNIGNKDECIRVIEGTSKRIPKIPSKNEQIQEHSNRTVQV